jgi:TolA-binding protein
MHLRAALWWAGLLPVLLSGGAAVRADVAESEAQIRQLAADVTDLAREANVQLAENRTQYVEEKLADADMFFRLGFYEEASTLYLDIVDNYPEQTAYADALFRLAESLYQSADPYGAREHFEKLLQHAQEPRFRPYVQQALSRLIEIAIRMEDFQGIERYFAELNRLPGSDIAAVTPYFRGKYYFFRGDLTASERAFLDVPDDSPYALQARYFLGAVYTKLRDFTRALDAFQRTLLLPVESDDDRQVIDLTYLALGRLQYELRREDDALQAYQQISTNSAFFDQALYEVAWVHLARGDTTKARRSLEMLVIYNPESRYAPEAKLLLGNILLREGRLVLNEECFLLDAEQRVADVQVGGTGVDVVPELPPECGLTPGAASAGTNYAIDAFRSVKFDYGPVFDDIARAMSSREQLRTYFSDMVQADAPVVTATNLLPPQARAWFQADQSVSRLQGLLDGLAAIRRYLAETERLAGQLEAILSGRNVAGAFSELRGVRDRTVVVANRCARVRAGLTAELDRSAPAAAGEMTQVREERRAIERQVARLPADADGMTAEYEAQRTGIDELSHTLTETTHTIELVESMSSALGQYVSDPANWGNMTATEIEAIRSELELIRGAVGHYRNQARDLRQRVDVVRAEVQVGEITAEAAQQIRDRHRDLVAREVSLAAASGSAGAVSRVGAALDSLARVEADLTMVMRGLEGQAQDRGRRLLETVRLERQRAVDYRSRLAGIESAAQDVIGGYAMHNFEAIAGRFQDLILRSDVGVTDSAWSLAEEHRRRMIQMGQQKERDLEAIRMEYDDLDLADQ